MLKIRPVSKKAPAMIRKIFLFPIKSKYFLVLGIFYTSVKPGIAESLEF